MSQKKKDWWPELDLDAEALAALDEARALPHGPERTEAMKKAGMLRNAADLQRVLFAKRGDPRKTRDFAATLNNDWLMKGDDRDCR